MKASSKPRHTRAEVHSNHYLDRRFDVVAIGASAGGLNAISQLLHPLAPNFPCSVLVVQHLDPKHKSLMTELLSRITAVHVKHAEHGEIMMPGVVYVAPPDEHLLVGPGTLQLAHSQLVHFSRPSIDLLFESVAGTYGSRAIGIVLSGSMHDGAAGIRTIKQAGGTTMAEDPAKSEFASMPKAAIATGCVDFVLPLPQLGPTLVQLCCGERMAP